MTKAINESIFINSSNKQMAQVKAAIAAAPLDSLLATLVLHGQTQRMEYELRAEITRRVEGRAALLEGINEACETLEFIDGTCFSNDVGESAVRCRDKLLAAIKKATPADKPTPHPTQPPP